MHGAASLVQSEMPPVDMAALWPYLDRTRHTAYHQTLLAGLRALYGLEGELDASSWPGLALLVQRAYERPDWFDSVLDRARTRLALWDCYFTVHDPVTWSKRVVPVFEVDDFLDQPWAHPQGGRSAADIAKEWGIELVSLRDLERTVDSGFERYRALGAVATKIGVAYRRSLFFGPATEVEAKAAFRQLKQEPTEPARLTLGNYMVRHILRRSADYNFVVQVHTGMNCGPLDWSRPTLLLNLFQEFPEVRFVLFHGSYPYPDEAGLLAKSFANVYLDLCWMPILSPSATIDALQRWLELVSHTKIMWGGDVWSVEEFYGATIAFKDVLAKVLGRMLSDGAITKSGAVELASSIMHDNATHLFKL